jgi:hypothetical protein
MKEEYSVLDYGLPLGAPNSIFERLQLDLKENKVEHYQIRLVKRIDNDGTIITFPNLGKMHQFHDQKTLKSYHSLDDATATARNLNQNLPSQAKGIVVVRFKPGKAMIASGSFVKPHIKARIRRSGTTEWLRFVSRENKVFSVSPKSHKIATQLEKNEEATP